MFHYGPHEKSVMHDHPGGVVVNITDGHLRFTDQHGNVQQVTSKHGEARWFKPFKHRVENQATRPRTAFTSGSRTAHPLLSVP